MSLMWRKSGLVNHAEIHDMFMFKFSTEIWTLKLHQVFISMFTLASPWFSCRFGQGKSPKLGCNSPVNTSRIPILSLSFRPYPSKRLHGWETEQLYINMGSSTLCLGDGWVEGRDVYISIGILYMVLPPYPQNVYLFMAIAYFLVLYIYHIFVFLEVYYSSHWLIYECVRKFWG